MPPAVARELSIVYGGTVLGGASDYMIDGKITIEKGYEVGRVACDVVLAGFSSEQAFADACAALEAAFRTPRQRLQVILGNETLIDWDPTPGTNTGFDAIPSIQKTGDDIDTARSRRYRVQVDVTLPADLTGQSGRRDSTITVEYTPSRRRRVTISGSYTALGERNATEQYLHVIDAYCESVLTGLQMPKRELSEESYNRNDTDKVLSFNRVYDELIYPQGQNTSTSAPDDPELVGTLLMIGMDRVAPGDSVLKTQTPQRLVRAVCTFETSVDATATQNLKEKYETSLRPWVLDRASALGGYSTFALVEETVEYDTKENRISGTLSIIGKTGGNLLEATVTVMVSETSGLVHVPVWSGDRFANYEFEGHSQKMRTVTLRTRRFRSLNLISPGGLGGSANAPNLPATGGSGGGASRDPDFDLGNINLAIDSTNDTIVDMDKKIAEKTAHWRPVSAERELTPVTLGLPPYQFVVLEETNTYTEVYVNHVRSRPITQRDGGIRGSSGSSIARTNPPTTGG